MAKELEFDADGVATISYNLSETTTWYISCWPKEVSYARNLVCTFSYTHLMHNYSYTYN